jgi:hypothetical protein
MPFLQTRKHAGLISITPPMHFNGFYDTIKDSLQQAAGNLPRKEF